MLPSPCALEPSRDEAAFRFTRLHSLSSRLMQDAFVTDLLRFLSKNAATYSDGTLSSSFSKCRVIIISVLSPAVGSRISVKDATFASGPQGDQWTAVQH